MDSARVRALMEGVREKTITPEAAVEALRDLPFEELGFAKVDHHRALRQGFPEVIFCPGKTAAQVAAIAASLHQTGSTVLATRAPREVFEAVQAILPTAAFHETARVISVAGDRPAHLEGTTGVICAGTGDIPVAEEAACCLEAMGAQVERIFDVGVAGLHRLLHFREKIQRCAVVIAVAGMEGAMPSVIGGLVDVPVIAVPTSIGYGASFGGLAALLGMLNSCANGIAVVNIDNGFGAAAFAASILRGRQTAA
ncbi:MAG TPA: nickel pincer cofactor biosynthesis protein LarB [Abditibacteriaceae bacterium]|nr:nickel pincer cofactor biosynthesis protein LarB [Abditibacteriaceae bacterium]